MSKLIRITESTYNELVKDAHYLDTIDSIIQRLLKFRDWYKQNVNSNLEENEI